MRPVRNALHRARRLCTTSFGLEVQDFAWMQSASVTWKSCAHSVGKNLGVGARQGDEKSEEEGGLQ